MRVLVIFWTAAILLSCVSEAQATVCSEASRPVVEVSFQEIPVKFDVSKSIETLSAIEVDTKAKLPAHYHTHIGGIMSSQISMDHRIGFNISDIDSSGEKCLRITHVKIDMVMEPTIFIAQDYQKQSCWFKGIFSHEAKHVDVDRAILTKYREQLTDALNMLLFVPSDYAVAVPEQDDIAVPRMELQQGLVNAMGVMFNKMMHDRKEQQQRIDNIHEYSALTRACRVSS